MSIDAHSFNEIYTALRLNGRQSAPRGEQTKELINFCYQLPPYERFADYPSRKLSLAYIRRELQWYLRGDLSDLSICDHAKIWRGCVQDETINSNYGYYLFKSGGLARAMALLAQDPASRRAVVPILALQHLRLDSRDTPCTVSLGFRILDAKLHLTVHMRSQDAIYGLGNDVPFFSVVQELALNLLNDRRAVAGIPALGMGPLTVFVESLHVYERHFDLLNAIKFEQVSGTRLPRLEAGEAETLVGCEALDIKPFTEWLYAPFE